MTAMEQKVAQFQQRIDDQKITAEATREVRAEFALSERLHEGTLLCVLEWTGEEGMTLQKLRTNLYKYLTLKNTHTK